MNNNTHYCLKMNWELNPRELETLEEVKNNLIQDCVDIMYQNLERNSDLENKKHWAQTILNIVNGGEEEIKSYAKDIGHTLWKENEFTRRLKRAYDDGEFYLLEEIEKIFKENEDNFKKDDCGIMIHSALIDSASSLQRASQVHDWSGIEDELYCKCCDTLMEYLGLTEKDIKKVRNNY